MPQHILHVLWLFLFHCYLSANKLVGWRTSYQGVSREFYATLRAYTWLSREVFNDTFLKTFHECTFTAFPILKKLGFAFGTENLNRLSRLFLVWFSHRR